jgi:uncharacterized protein (DUF2141 family)
MTTRSAFRTIGPIGLALLTAGVAVTAQVLAIALASSALVGVAHAQPVPAVTLAVTPAVTPAVALTMFQDLDGDGQMGRNVLGIPLEPWGASGSPGAMGPTWQASRVPLDGSAIVVNLSL